MLAMTPVRRAVILAAGLGTRLLPATKSVPKEMLPLVDRPIIQYTVEEAVAAGVEEIVLVLAPDRRAIREHFGGGARIEAIARERGDAALTERVLAPERLAKFTFVEQREPLGTGHALLQAQPCLEGEPFALLFPDDVIFGKEPCTAQLVRAFAASDAAAVIAVQQVPHEQLPQYGVVDAVSAVEEGVPVRLRGIVEKPAADAAPSSMGVVGRYVLGPSIFGRLAALTPGAGGELQLTDAIAGLIAAGESVCACRFQGQRYDAGRPAGAIAAAVAAALEREELRPDLLARLAALMPTEQSPCAS